MPKCLFYILLVLFLSALIIRLFFNVGIYDGDPIAYYMVGLNFPCYYANSCYQGFISPTVGFSFLIFVVSFFGTNPALVPFINPVLGALSVVFAFLFARELSNSNLLAFLVSLFLVFQETHLFASIVILTDILGFTCMMAIGYFSIKAVKAKPGNYYTPTFFIMLGLALITRPPAVLFVGVLSFWLLLTQYKKIYSVVINKKIIPYLIVFLLIVSTQLIFNKYHYNSLLPNAAASYYAERRGIQSFSLGNILFSSSDIVESVYRGHFGYYLHQIDNSIFRSSILSVFFCIGIFFMLKEKKFGLLFLNLIWVLIYLLFYASFIDYNPRYILEFTFPLLFVSFYGIYAFANHLSKNKEFKIKKSSIKISYIILLVFLPLIFAPIVTTSFENNWRFKLFQENQKTIFNYLNYDIHNLLLLQGKNLSESYIIIGKYVESTFIRFWIPNYYSNYIGINDYETIINSTKPKFLIANMVGVSDLDVNSDSFKKLRDENRLELLLETQYWNLYQVV